MDGVWGKADILFPFAVYEAKKRAVKHEEAENQIYNACKVYMAMLDDLARNPNNVAEYQTTATKISSSRSRLTAHNGRFFLHGVMGPTVHLEFNTVREACDS
ncbi:hypothetical protein AUP68_00112 [Ilyonectria robusta]